MLNSTAAARKHIVATTPATTGRASPSSGNSAGGKGSAGGSGGSSEGLTATIFSYSLFLFAERPTCTGDSHNVAALTDQVDHDSHYSELIPGILWFEKNPENLMP